MNRHRHCHTPMHCIQLKLDSDPLSVKSMHSLSVRIACSMFFDAGVAMLSRTWNSQDGLFLHAHPKPQTPWIVSSITPTFRIRHTQNIASNLRLARNRERIQSPQFHTPSPVRAWCNECNQNPLSHSTPFEAGW